MSDRLDGLETPPTSVLDTKNVGFYSESRNKGNGAEENFLHFALKPNELYLQGTNVMNSIQRLLAIYCDSSRNACCHELYLSYVQ